MSAPAASTRNVDSGNAGLAVAAFIGLLTVALYAGIYFVAWWMIPVCSAVYALIRRRRSAPLECASAALLASSILLLLQLRSPAFNALLDALGRIFPVPGVLVLLLSIVLAMLLAYSSARVTIGAVGIRGVAPREGR